MVDQLAVRLSQGSELYARIRAAALEGIYIYGAGFVGSWAVSYLEELCMPVIGFIDSDLKKQGCIVSGKPILGLDDPGVRSAKVILIGSRHAVPSIKNVLANSSALIMSVDAFVVHQQWNEAIDRLEALFSHDQQSLKTVQAVLLSMLEGTTKPLSDFADNKPFFDKFGFFNRNGEIFVDAGAYVGDSVERFLWSVNGVFEHIHAFEPGLTQYQAMIKRVDRLIAEWALTSEKISLINKGISDVTRSVKIKSGSQLIQTRIEQIGAIEGPGDSSVTVDTISLDEYFDGDAFTFLKVDIEGSESAMLDGAVNSIRKWRPRMALSVYHYPIDIFELPNKCSELNPDYRFSISHHSSQLMDTVLYCKDKND
jgi:FkbM family methyltransferase